MKIAVSGKGGVGKTTIAGVLARTLVHRGFKVLAIDADPNANLALSLGISPNMAEKIVPISENADLIEEKTGVRPGSSGSVFRLSFRVDDILDNFSLKSPDGVNLLVMGAVKAAGGGCMCSANALVRSLLRYLLVKRDEAVVVDMEAGTEHLGRGTAEAVDVMLVVTEANLKALETAKRVYKLSEELGIKRIFIVGNKVVGPSDEDMIRRFCDDNDLPLLELIPYDEEMRQADARGDTLIDFSSSSKGISAIQKMGEKLLKTKGKS